MYYTYMHAINETVDHWSIWPPYTIGTLHWYCISDPELLFQQLGNPKCTSGANKLVFLFLDPDSKIVVRTDPQTRCLECPFEGIVVLRVRSMDDFKCKCFNVYNVFLLLGVLAHICTWWKRWKLKGWKYSEYVAVQIIQKNFHSHHVCEDCECCKEHFKSWNCWVLLGSDFDIFKLTFFLSLTITKIHVW